METIHAQSVVPQKTLASLAYARDTEHALSQLIKAREAKGY
jgi:hypothetical protein